MRLYYKASYAHGNKKYKFDMIENQNHWKDGMREHNIFGSIRKEQMERS